MKNESGYILPSVSILSLFFLMILFHHSALYITEKKFYEDRSESVLLENLMLYGVKHSLHQITGEEMTDQQLIKFKKGTIVYTVSEIDPEYILVELSCETENKNFTSAKYRYSIIQKKIVYWTVY
ncbi:competence type IV pilus minor pilin ComGG [Metabacillus idriensis]|uniref:competence type IV pilus minor pilin ComGG n=1 Tax=Metabacillus idriensis TaxID=324768 RepID=UPI003D2A8D4A